jgi:hypothetical protein
MRAKMSIKQATREYEAWLGERITIVPEDLDKKHQDMASDAFIFLRATYYRWAQVWPSVCAEFAKAPVVLAVGDLHIENFGTWRDTEGRLIWGVNDFDEAYPLPYASDLIRLATSTALAVSSKSFELTLSDACDAILKGYTHSINIGGKPFVLAEENTDLRTMAESELRDPVRFWKKMDGQSLAEMPLPAGAVEALEHALPETGIAYRVVRRRSGEGSLGRQRFVALADWCGGRIAREAKALAPSASLWANGGSGPKDIFYQTVMENAVRCKDPFVELRGQWVLRRLAPDCARIGLASLTQSQDETCLLEAMGWETANIHLATQGALNLILKDLKGRHQGWLAEAAMRMAKELKEDWKAWAS